MKICVDPGHGGTDPGAVGQNPFPLNEKNITLAISLLLQNELEENGHTVIMTREVDKDVSLNSRSNVANNNNVDIFVSIHCNSFDNSNAEGIETWIFPGSDQGFILANKVQESLIETFSDHINRGVKEGNFHVLRETSMPAILVECEFISNPNQLVFLADKSNQEKIAKAIASGI